MFKGKLDALFFFFSFLINSYSLSLSLSLSCSFAYFNYNLFKWVSQAKGFRSEKELSLTKIAWNTNESIAFTEYLSIHVHFLK